MIGNGFFKRLDAAGISDRRFTWTPDGTLAFDPAIDPAAKAAILAAQVAYAAGGDVLQDAREAKLTELKSKRDALAYGDNATIPYMGKTFNVAQDDLSRMTLAVSLLTAASALPPDQQAQLPAQFPATITWTTADNTDVDLTFVELIQLYVLAGMNMMMAFSVYRVLRAQVGAATTVAEVNAISWP